MDIAIYFEKIEIGDNKYVFKPINVIKGNFNKEDSRFKTDYGVICGSISGDDIDRQDFFGFPTPLETLKTKLGRDVSEEVILSEYFNLFSEYCYLAYLDFEDYKIKTIRILLEELEENMEKLNNSSKNSQDVECTQENEEEIEESLGAIFDLDFIISLRDMDSLNEIRSTLDKVICDLFGDEVKDIKNKLSLKKEESQKFNLKKMRREISTKIIGQEKAINDITREIIINETSDNPRNKSHLLVTGPTGTGKTEIVSIMARLLDKPFFEADATAYTKEGYVGKSVYSMLYGLLNAANGDVEKAQNGILVIDEIDKKLSEKDDVSGVAVLQSMLKIMDRGVIELSESSPMKETIMFDTSNLTVILMGAFESIYNKKLKSQKRAIGFSTDDKNKEIPKTEIEITKKDLIEAGFPAELLGRIGDVTSTYYFIEKDLSKILTKSEISALLIFKEFLKQKYDIELKYTSGYINEIARQAIETGTNARELKPLVRSSLKYALDEIFNGSKAKELKLTKETAINNKKYYLK